MLAGLNTVGFTVWIIIGKSKSPATEQESSTVIFMFCLVNLIIN